MFVAQLGSTLFTEVLGPELLVIIGRWRRSVENCILRFIGHTLGGKSY